MCDYICSAYHLLNNVFRFNNGKTRMRQYFSLTMEKQEWCRRNDIPEWWWWLWRPRNQNVFVVAVVAANVRDHERGNGMARMREEWRECERNWEGLRDERWRETETCKWERKAKKPYKQGIRARLLRGTALVSHIQTRLFKQPRLYVLQINF